MQHNSICQVTDLTMIPCWLLALLHMMLWIWLWEPRAAVHLVIWPYGTVVQLDSKKCSAILATNLNVKRSHIRAHSTQCL